MRSFSGSWGPSPVADATTEVRCLQTEWSDFTVFETSSGFGVRISNSCDRAMISLVTEIKDATLFTSYAAFPFSVLSEASAMGLG
jgi:hypothetical protein